MSEPIPSAMRAIHVVQHLTALPKDVPDGIFEIRQIEVPQPEPGEVLIKVACADLAPSDISQARGVFGGTGEKRPVPYVVGTTGSGVVVASGGGLIGRMRMGKRVAFGKPGCWAEYITLDAKQAIPLPRQISLPVGAVSLANPLTAVAFLDIAARQRARTILLPVAASALGRMLIRLAKRRGVRVIATVRRQAQVELLQNNLDVEHVLLTRDEHYDRDLAALCDRLDCRLAFDCTGGAMTVRHFHALPRDSVLYIYGAMVADPQLSDVEPGEFIFHNKQLRGFFLFDYMESLSLPSVLSLVRRVQSQIATTLRSEVRQVFPFERVHEAMRDYANNMSAGKVVLSASSELESGD